MRSLFSNPRHESERRSRPRAGRLTQYALYIALASFLWGAFKYIEPTVFPVVKDFTITSAEPAPGNRIKISGTFKKVRDCEFSGVIGYSGDQYVSITFSAAPDARVVSRIMRKQTFGPWLLVPKVSHLELYARHNCSTGEVVTKVFDGAIVL